MNNNNTLGGFMRSMTGEESSPVGFDDSSIEDVDQLEDKDIETPVDNEEEDAEDKGKGDQKTVKKDTPVKEEDPVDLSDDDFDSEEETLIATSVYEAMAERLGIDHEEDEDGNIVTPTSFDELAEKMLDIVSERSTPAYFSEDVKNLDEFVRNGGDIREFFKTYGNSDFSEADTKTEAGQKRLLRLELQAQGFTDSEIEAKIERYDLGDMLEEESKDAFKRLSKRSEDSKKAALAEQQRAYEEHVAAQQEAYEKVVTSIKELTEFNGVRITNKDRTDLAKYLFEKGQDGYTKWQKDSSDVNNIVKIAMMLQKGDSLMKSVENKGKSAAFRKMREQLKNPGTSRAGRQRAYEQASSEEDVRVATDLISKTFGI